MVIYNYNRANDVAGWPCVCGNQLPERLMSPSQKSQVMFASAFSRIDDFFVFLAFIVFKYFLQAGWICTYTLTGYAALTSCARVRNLAIGRRVHMALQQCWGCHCGPGGTQFLRRQRLLARVQHG